MTINALWIPAWYELDPSIVVGVTEEFIFHKPTTNGALRFYSGAENIDAVRATGAISSIYHAVLGDIESVDAQGLDYTIVLKDGRRLLVNAEEDPGLIYEWVDDSWQPSEMTISDWQLEVKFTSLSPLTSVD
ncbi:hypothetical protein N5094_18670 [Shewanella putrefaciens]|jgi:hypothetical protein|uniref:Uncharacterized protein n=2 Tax=Shewanella putrefaciens TaxID=24 RepID=E6XRN5_SHEP2|nr:MULTISPECIES: hypothetical protein [Shewanella]CAD6367456.1 hypothetical protein SHEWT2_02768 [Shewanella hafniensis]ABM23087.1 conserved hypothetical protein [Shewanella sp. W3-18-1]MCA1898417.1 hypothetical protein [Shewanella putrefaciens]MCT8944301.1 hypothetical protein [Shewanella putrefaciens]MDR6965404.1 hypothetical protein [Shewanella putrefaciens]